MSRQSQARPQDLLASWPDMSVQQQAREHAGDQASAGRSMFGSFPNFPSEASVCGLPRGSNSSGFQNTNSSSLQSAQSSPLDSPGLGPSTWPGPSSYAVGPAQSPFTRIHFNSSTGGPLNRQTATGRTMSPASPFTSSPFDMMPSADCVGLNLNGVNQGDCSLLHSSFSSLQLAQSMPPSAQPQLLARQDSMNQSAAAFQIASGSLADGLVPCGVTPSDVMAAAAATSASLYVKNLPPEETELDLYRLFAPLGAVLSCKVLTDTETGRCKGVGFVNYREHGEAVRAIQQLNGMRIGSGRCLQITLQAPRPVRAAAAAAVAATPQSYEL